MTACKPPIPISPRTSTPPTTTTGTAATDDPNPGTGDDHGTSCAGNAAATGNNGLGVSGTAPEATLVGLRLIAAVRHRRQGSRGHGLDADIIQIKTNSWGPNDNGITLEGPGPLTLAALPTATTTGRGGKGTIFLWAGGNGGDVGDNSNYDGYANSIYTIAIGATDSAGSRAYYSEPGGQPRRLRAVQRRSPALGITTVDRTGANGYNTATSGNRRRLHQRLRRHLVRHAHRRRRRRPDAPEKSQPRLARRAGNPHPHRRTSQAHRHRLGHQSARASISTTSSVPA